MSEKWTGVTYESEHVVVHKLIDPGAWACILHQLLHVNECHMNMILSVVYFALKEKVMVVNMCSTLRKQPTQ